MTLRDGHTRPSGGTEQKCRSHCFYICLLLVTDFLFPPFCFRLSDPLHLPDAGPPSRVPAERRNQNQPLFQQRPRLELPPLEAQSEWHTKPCERLYPRCVYSTYAEVSPRFFFPQTPAEHEAEMGIKSKEARKYIFNCLDDMMQVRKEDSFQVISCSAKWYWS